MFFISCFSMVIINSGDILVYELQAHFIFLHGLHATMTTKNKQSVIRPYIT